MKVMKHTIIENNSAIAEFMGCELEEAGNGEMVYPINHGSFRGNTEFYRADELQYHNFLAWCVPVFKRIASLDLGESGDIEKLKVVNAYFSERKSVIYKALVNFVKWYNLNVAFDVDITELHKEIASAKTQISGLDMMKCIAVVVTKYDLLNPLKVNYGFRFMYSKFVKLGDIIKNADGTKSRVDALLFSESNIQLLQSDGVVGECR